MVKCDECGSENNLKSGKEWRKRKKNIQRYRCKDCGKLFRIEENIDSQGGVT